ncbi:MAG TPA: tetraacyldisaccharide 4'-kinase [Burkholderiales bacterium]|nr:tetraacyldisaccharide 4'-kinase [Burkholderiales bacterium]
MLLTPLAAVYGATTALRRALYRAGLLPEIRLPVPVIVVGNIVAGGTGKTPLVLWLCNFLAAQGYRPGIVSRGYGGGGRTMAARENAARSVGDEPALLAGKSSCPVWVGTDRAEAALALLAANPGCNLIVSDDGLQHYRLQRDVEIAVVDATRGNGNGLLIPAGPLREGAGRLSRVDAVIVNGADRNGLQRGRNPHTFAMALEGATLRNLLNPACQVEPGFFRGKRVHAVAGIGNPARFFDQLHALGLEFTAHAFADHHEYTAAEVGFAGADAIVMTEKDAIKCRDFASEILWVLPVEARVDEALGRVILEKLNLRPD